MYNLEITPSANRDLEKLKQRIQKRDFERLRIVITSLIDDPFPLGTRKLKGAEKLYRIRVGHYRILYEVYQNEKLIIIMQIVRRSDTTYNL